MVETKPVCWGSDYPAPDLPELDLHEPGMDLPDDDLIETGPDNINPGDSAVTGTQVESRSEADVTEEVCTQACDACSAARLGAARWRSYEEANAEYHEENTWQGYRYQHYICGLPHEPVRGRIMEWFFVNYYWDGFESATCRMIEAKYGYSSLLEHFYEPSRGPGSAVYSVRPLPGRDMAARSSFRGLLKQAATQKTKLIPFPEVGLLWVFSEFEAFIFFQSVGGTALLIDVDHRPIERI